jgi:transposase
VTRAAPYLTLEEVKQRTKREQRFWVRQRWWIIYHVLLAPRTAQEIARQTDTSARTVRRVIASYNREGERSTQTPGTGGRRHAYLTLEQERAFLQPFFARAKLGEIATVEQIQRAFESEVKHVVHVSTIYRLLHRHGWRKLVPRPQHPKADPQKQAAFLKDFPAIVQAAVATRAPGDQRPVLLMAQDEGRFGRISVSRRAWVPPGIRPHTAQQIVREYLYVYAAVAPQAGKMTALILPSADTEMMNLFLSHVARTNPHSFIIMQMDQAKWHQAKDLEVPENIRLILQPPYSPDLNPVEHMWEDLREKQFPNVACSSLEQVIDRLCEGLTQLEAEPKRLRSMTYFPHFRRAAEALRWEEEARSVAA